jgi:hypothetical protein
LAKVEPRVAKTSPGVGTWVTNRIGFWIAAAVVARETNCAEDGCAEAAIAASLLFVTVSASILVPHAASSIESPAVAHKIMLFR